MKLRKKLFIIFLLICCALLVILIPAIFSHSKDIRQELALNFGIPEEPEVNFIPNTLELPKVSTLPKTPLNTFALVSFFSYPENQAQTIIKQIQNLGFSAFLMRDLQHNNFYFCVVGPFLNEASALETLNLLARKKVFSGKMVARFPSLERLKFQES